MASVISLSIRDFAVPVPRVGSIEAHSGYGRSAQEGQELHQQIQERRALVDSAYEAEVPLSADFERDGFLFRIAGRMDGIFRSETPRIEEIKTTFNVKELYRKLTDSDFQHPYCLQLLTYGYFLWLEQKVVPELSFHLVSTRSGDTDDLELKLDIPNYEKWLNLRLEELVLEARQAEKRSARRRKIGRDFLFPFENPRPGQLELIETIEQGMAERKRMLIQAPTGLGKTVGVLYPVLKEALGRGQRAIYVTPKNSQHSVAEDAIERFQDNGAALKSLTITAKSKICFKNEPLCNPEYCEYARDYYSKVAANGLLDILARKKSLKSKVFRDLGEEYQVCPFELQLDGSREADTIICDYNYVFAPRSAFGRLSGLAMDQEGLPNLVIDEAHNLPSRAMDFYSPALSSLTLEKMREEMADLPETFRREGEAMIDACIQTILACSPPESGVTRPRGKDFRGGARIQPSLHPFVEQDGGLRAFLTRYLESNYEIQPRDVILRFCFYWSEFTEALESVIDGTREEFFVTYQPSPTGGIVRITCCDASEMLEPCYDAYEQVVAFSATLKPFEYYSRLSGLDPETVKTAEFGSPFPRERRKVLVIPQVSTKYADRERNYPKIAEAIDRIVTLKRGNYFAFFPSFDFMERVLGMFRPPEGYVILRQEREMKSSDIEAVLEHLRERSRPAIVFGVQGGVFSEGVDYPGEMLIGAFVIGPPLPNFDLEREQMREYYQKNYNAGFDYAYTYPAMSKAVQAAGRVIRSEKDRGLIVLMDQRFALPAYSRSMPRDWFEAGVGELISGSILKDISGFWESEDLG